MNLCLEEAKMMHWTGFAKLPIYMEEVKHS